MAALVRCTAFVLIGAIAVAGCTDHRRFEASNSIEPATSVHLSDQPAMVAMGCSSPMGAVTDAKYTPEVRSLEAAMPRLSVGDVVRIDIVDGDTIAGNFAVNFDGRIVLPFAGAVQAAGLSLQELERKLAARLVAADLFPAGEARVAVLPLRWSAIQVAVSGAVYQPGRYLINEPNAEKLAADTLVKTGDSPVGRFLDAGIRSGSGVRPDADLSSVTLIRRGKSYLIDLSGLIVGAPAPNIPLLADDHIVVPSRGCFQFDLMRPSQLTPPGIRVFLSNLTVPARDNSSAAIGNFSSTLPYGTRLIEGAVSANWFGGTQITNAERRVLLISRNPITGKTDVIERRIADLLGAPDDLSTNPYLLPNDAIACYDSAVTNLDDAMCSLGGILAVVSQAASLL